MSEQKTVVIPVPMLAPFGVEIDSSGVKEVWDTFIQPDQDAGLPQSMETRLLMAILRSVYAGMEEAERGDTAVQEG